MFRPFAHPVACCSVLVGVLASVWTPLQHERNNTQHSWRNNVGSCCVRLHVVKRLTGFELCATTLKNPQRRTTTCNRVCKRTQRATSNNIVAMLGIVGQQCCVRLHWALQTQTQLFGANRSKISKEKSGRNRIARLFLFTSSSPLSATDTIRIIYYTIWAKARS